MTDATEAQGWRTWSAYPGVSDVLHSPWRPASLRGTDFATWTRRVKVAECGADALAAHRRFGAERTLRHGLTGSPDADCTCGIGFYPHFNGLLRRYVRFREMNADRPLQRNYRGRPPHVVVGRITVSGVIRGRGRKGASGLDTAELRCERARIEELWIPAAADLDVGELREQFANRYRIPVHIGFPERIELPTNDSVAELTRARDAEIHDLLSRGVEPGRA